MSTKMSQVVNLRVHNIAISKIGIAGINNKERKSDFLLYLLGKRYFCVFSFARKLPKNTLIINKIKLIISVVILSMENIVLIS